jgi:hypothetical protein
MKASTRTMWSSSASRSPSLPWRPLLLIAVACACGGVQHAVAAYQRMNSAPVRVVEIYANEHGSPFVYFDAVVNSGCSGGGRGLYLYNLEVAADAQLRNNKMAMLLMAKAMDRPVVLDYFVDPAKSANWDACYIHGLYLK